MTFAIERNLVDGAACVAVAGEVDVETAPRMRDAVVEAVADGRPVVVDLGSVTFMDSSGLSALVAAHRVAEARGVPLQLRNVPRRVMKLVAITGLDSLLSIETVPTDAAD
jgi:anti-sigma B factor antagonist